ncbi:MAG: hypothetical protein H8D24_07435 [Gammaproteobacteria bacterium]|uniref:Crp/Fnr family transcriptional regulator n=1 Tax=Candidatus Thiopontia autotrophica TaxID=2841688 RepID=A0A8J6PBQ0_9GAMM|nr:hypothetical protein [Candidatus Thiopontia autotrophica]MBL6968653.1 hypothetical protein [Gammaproteobacteria bacterium]
MDAFDQLRKIFSALSGDDRNALLRYATFLHHDGDGVKSGEVVEAAAKENPQGLLRPKNERVVMAIRRLSETYPMLNHDKLLKQSADLMSAHLVSGREAAEVIDELEEIFQSHYQIYIDE